MESKLMTILILLVVIASAFVTNNFLLDTTSSPTDGFHPFEIFSGGCSGFVDCLDAGTDSIVFFGLAILALILGFVFIPR